MFWRILRKFFENFLTNFSNFFKEFFDKCLQILIFFPILTFTLLTIASFGIGVPSILFYWKKEIPSILAWSFHFKAYLHQALFFEFLRALSILMILMCFTGSFDLFLLFLSSPIACVACERTELLKTEIHGWWSKLF